MGTVDAKLEASIVPVLSKYIPNIEDVEITTRQSKGGKFAAITAKFVATDQEQLDNIYRELSARPDVLMVL